MAKLFKLPTFLNEKGSLSEFDEILPKGVKRIFYIHNAENQVRGGHRHKRSNNALICISGSCEVYNNDGIDEKIFFLDSPDVCLLLEPKDWHTMHKFSKNTILLVLSDSLFEKEDYIYEKYDLNSQKILEF